MVSVVSAASIKKYGIAGCGLGSMAMGKSGNQVLAATTNGTSYSQFFGITSGTSNCAEDGLAMVDKEKEYFANANYESLMQEMAQGKGENLVVMASLFGCQSETFSSSMKTNYGKIFPNNDTDSEGMLGNMEELVVSNPDLKNACKDIN